MLRARRDVGIDLVARDLLIGNSPTRCPAIAPPNSQPRSLLRAMMRSNSSSPVMSGCPRKYSRPACQTSGSRTSRSASFRGSLPRTNVRPKSASPLLEDRPQVDKHHVVGCDDAVGRTVAGGFECVLACPHDALCQCRFTPNMLTARSRISSDTVRSLTPARTSCRPSTSSNSCAAFAWASSSLATRESSSTPAPSTNRC